jgi:DNA-binding GntR family transcriptional regulator
MAQTTHRRPLLTDVVRSQLRAEVIGGKYPPGSRLPNEQTLCERFEVSRATLREAVKGLVEDGMLVVRHGSGTYVRHRPSLRNSLDTNFSYTDYLASTGREARKELISLETVESDDETAQALELTAGARVVEAKRTRTVDGRAAIYSVDLIPAQLLGTRQPARSAFLGSLYHLLDKHGHVVDHAEAFLAPVLADGDVAAHLDVPEGAPVQYLRQVDLDTNEGPLMLSHEWHAPAVIELRVFRRGPGPRQHRP